MKRAISPRAIIRLQATPLVHHVALAVPRIIGEVALVLLSIRAFLVAAPHQLAELDTNKIPRLASFAAVAGFDWVLNERDHVHASVSARDFDCVREHTNL